MDWRDTEPNNVVTTFLNLLNDVHFVNFLTGLLTLVRYLQWVMRFTTIGEIKVRSLYNMYNYHVQKFY